MMHLYKLLTNFYFNKILFPTSYIYIYYFSYRLYLYLCLYLYLYLNLHVYLYLHLYFSASYGQTNGFALQEPIQIILNLISEDYLNNCFFLYWSIHCVRFHEMYWWTGNLVMDRRGT